MRAAQLGLREHDEKQLYMARQHLYDLRNIHAYVRVGWTGLC
jgi:hypothetical protein